MNSIDRAPCMAGCGRERPVDQLVVRRDHAAQAPRPVVRVCPGCAEEPRYVAVDSDGEKNVSQDTLYPSEVVLS